MNNDKFDAITGDKFVCCCDCGKWFPSTKAFTKFYSSTALMLCPKCVNNLEQDIRRYKVKEAPATDVVEVLHGRWEFGKDLPDSFGSISKNKYHLYCSECRNQAFNKSTDNDCDFDMDTPFCPWCGAKMDKEETNEL